MLKYLNPLKIFNDIEDGKIYIRPIGLIFSIFIIILDLLIISITETPLICLLKILGIKSNLIFNIALFFIQSFTALISLNIIVFISRSKSPDINYRSNIKLTDIIYILLLILGFRILYEGSIYQFKNFMAIDLNLDSILLSCIYAPFVEEMLYRGIILNGTLKKYGQVPAIIISAGLFGLMHFNLFQSLNAFCMALIMGYIYTKTKSLYLCIFLHLSNNIIAMYVKSLLFSNIFVHFIYIIFNLCLGGLLIYVALSKMQLQKRSKNFTDSNDEFNFFLDKFCE